MTSKELSDLECAIIDVEQAFRLLEFSIRISNYFELDGFELEKFGRDTIVVLDEENVTFRDGFFIEADNLGLTASIAIGVSFGTTAIVLDNLFELVGQGRDPVSENEFDVLRALVYAVRNAFAHGAANPKWVVKEIYQRELELSVGGTKTTISLGELNGQEFRYANIGGITQWFHIKDRVLEIITDAH